MVNCGAVDLENIVEMQNTLMKTGLKGMMIHLDKSLILKNKLSPLFLALFNILWLPIEWENYLDGEIVKMVSWVHKILFKLLQSIFRLLKINI
jgi:hypothetical protein